MAVDNDDILDPAHLDNEPGATVVAGVPQKDTTPPPADKVTPDGNIIERDGKKYIVMDAFVSERNKAREYAETLSNLDPVMPEFQEFLQTREGRRTAVRDAAARNGEQDDPAYLDEVATALGYFTEQGQPDHRRAQAHLNFTRRENARQNEQSLKPVVESLNRERARTNREAALSRNFVDGKPIADQKYVQLAMSKLPDEFIADENIANVTHIIAAGLEYLDKRKNGTLAPRGSRGSREPMFTEGTTGRFDGDDGELSDFDRAAARARGKSPDEWVKMSKRLNKDRRTRGDSNILEEV